MAFIEIENVTFGYRPEEPPVLENFSLSIEKGTYTAILGHNGSGKSTLAKLLCGINTPSAGSVRVASFSTADETELLRLREHCGMVFQNPDNQLVASVVEEDGKPRRPARGNPPARGRRAADRRHGGIRRPRDLQALRRAEAARGHRGDPRHGAGLHRLRRGHGDARPDRAAGHRRGHEAPQRGEGHHGHHHHPLYERGRRGRPRHRAEPRRHPARRHAEGDFFASRAAAERLALRAAGHQPALRARARRL